jgi:hypothetical protein
LARAFISPRRLSPSSCRLALGSAIRQLRQAGLNNAAAHLLMTRKRAELERSDVVEE